MTPGKPKYGIRECIDEHDESMESATMTINEFDELHVGKQYHFDVRDRWQMIIYSVVD